MARHVWLRLGKELPGGDLALLAQAYPNVRFDAGDTPANSEAIDVVFTISLLPDPTTQQLTSLKWLHTTFGEGNGVSNA